MTDDSTLRASFRVSNEFEKPALLRFFALTSGISWLIWAPLRLPTFGVRGLPVFPFHHAMGALGPITSAFVLTWRRGGIASVRALFCRMVLLRGRVRWLFIAAFAPFVLLAISLVIALLLQHTPISFRGFGKSREFQQFPALGFLGYNIVSFGFGEEVGWRGFA